MKGMEIARWGIPLAGFIAYVKWGGVSLALLFALILFAGVSGLIHWHRKDPVGFYRHIRAIVVILVLLPAIGITLIAAFSGLLGLLVALPVLIGAILLTRWANRKSSAAPAEGVPSTAAQNLQAANALIDTTRENNRRSQTRGSLMHVQAENLELLRKNTALEDDKAALSRRISALEREAALPPDPFADPPQRS